MIITGMNQCINRLTRNARNKNLFVYLDINRASTGILGSFLSGKTEENLRVRRLSSEKLQHETVYDEVIPHLHLTEEVLGGLATTKKQKLHD